VILLLYRVGVLCAHIPVSLTPKASLTQQLDAYPRVLRANLGTAR